MEWDGIFDWIHDTHCPHVTDWRETRSSGQPRPLNTASVPYLDAWRNANYLVQSLNGGFSSRIDI
jgi:hypothetical protein